MKVIIAGSRNFDNFELLKNKCDLILSNVIVDEIVSGTAKGVDMLGEKYANYKNFKIMRFPADWDVFGKRAGFLRNEEMAKYADALIAFWDGESKGTKHMINLANKYNLKVRVVKI